VFNVSPHYRFWLEAEQGSKSQGQRVAYASVYILYLVDIQRLTASFRNPDYARCFIVVIYTDSDTVNGPSLIQAWSERRVESQTVTST